MKNDRFLKSKTGMILTALFCNLLWGSAFPFIKIGYKAFGIASEDISSQILFAGSRFTIAGILTILIGSLLARQPLLPNRKSWPHILTLSLFQTILQYFFFYIALAHTTGVKASIIEASNVFMAILFAAVFLHDENNMVYRLLWCIPGFAGILLINLNGSSFTFDMSWKGEGFILISTMAAAMASVLIKKFSRQDSPVLLSGWQFLIGGMLMVLVSLIMHGRLQFNIAGWMIVLYLAFVSAAAYSLWGLLLKYHPVSKVSVFSFSNPVFGVLLSSLILHEDILSYGIRLPVALALVAAAIYAVNKNS